MGWFYVSLGFVIVDACRLVLVITLLLLIARFAVCFSLL